MYFESAFLKLLLIILHSPIEFLSFYILSSDLPSPSYLYTLMFSDTKVRWCSLWVDLQMGDTLCFHVFFLEEPSDGSSVTWQIPSMALN